MYNFQMMCMISMHYPPTFKCLSSFITDHPLACCATQLHVRGQLCWLAGVPN